MARFAAPLSITIHQIAYYDAKYLLSEIAKADGTDVSQAKMWRHARGALRHLEEAIGANPVDRRLYPRLREMRAATRTALNEASSMSTDAAFGLYRRFAREWVKAFA